jgi:D-alanine transaminase
MIIYFNGKYIKEEKCHISPYDRGFLFADGIYEVLRYTGKKYFEFDSHMQRLYKGLIFLKIKFRDTNKLLKICNELLRKNNLLNKETLIYIQITRGISKPRYHTFPSKNTPPTVFINATPLLENKFLKKGVSVILDEDIRWSRCNIKTISLLPNVLANQKAKEKKVFETVFVRDGKIMEGSHTNFFGVKKSCIYTAPLSNYILPGVTRNAILKICKNNKIPIKETYIRKNDIKNFDELFLTSTTMDVTPVLKIDGKTVGNGYPGIITTKIKDKYLEKINS